jgi:hemerythrin-like domain-containing protein
MSNRDMDTVSGPMLSFHLYHRAMRAGAARLTTALDRAENVRRFEPWFAHYRQACLIHADGEDKVLWPALAEQRPDLGDVFATMDSEHDVLQRVLAELGDAISEGDAQGARRLAHQLEEVVGHHLDGEERDAVPPLVEALDADLGDLMRKVQQNAGPEGAALAIPFFLEQAAPEERAAALAAMPPPVREGYEQAWSGSYAALVSALAG